MVQMTFESQDRMQTTARASIWQDRRLVLLKFSALIVAICCALTLMGAVSKGKAGTRSWSVQDSWWGVLHGILPWNWVVPSRLGLLGNQGKPPCVLRTSDTYTDGEWEKDDSSAGFPYESDKDPVWHPHCDAIQTSFHSTGVRPDHLGYSWEPRTCKLASSDVASFCHTLEGATVGVVGDSTSQHFIDSLVGQALGKVQRALN